MMLSINENIVYNLKCFIEVFTNLVYIYDNNNWIKVCANIQYEKVDNIENIKPVFYFINYLLKEILFLIIIKI